MRSSFGDAEGTWIGEEDEQMLEKAIISGVTHDTDEAKVTIIGVPDRPGIAARVFRPLADAGVNIDMIVQNVSEHGQADDLVHAAEDRHRGRRAHPPVHGARTGRHASRRSRHRQGFR